MNHNWELLEELCAVHAVSGREDRMVSFLENHLRDQVEEVEVDQLGNLVAIVEGAHTPDRRLLLQAHMDELGLIVRGISEDGFLLVERVGGVPEKSLLGQRVEVLTEQEDLVSG